MTILHTWPLPMTSLRPMLRDLHGRINTTSFGYGKLLPYQARVPAAASTLFEAILLHHLKLIFYDVGGTLFPSNCTRRAALARYRGQRYQ
jgi:hypothetical protein